MAIDHKNRTASMNDTAVTSKQAENASQSGPSPRLQDGQAFITVSPDDRILVTGAAGFIGSRVVENLLDRGFRNLVCFGRSSGKLSRVQNSGNRYPEAQVQLIAGNLLSRRDCEIACKDVKLIFHLAAGTGEKSFPDAFMNSVVTTRNLLDASLQAGRLQRFVLVSSSSVYTNCEKPHGRLLDETCATEEHGELRGEAYCFAKYHQEKLLAEYHKEFGVPYAVIRPGSVYGPKK